MAALAQFLLSIFAYFANFVVAKLGARYGIRLALVAVWVALLATVTATVNGVLSGLVSLAGGIHPVVETGLGILPSVTGGCIAAIAATRAACWLYVTGVHAASVKARI
ncbi:DUF5455 family protein [Stutzerimonas stutzeri]|uniref:DUF5455 family protein n=1 Tax=Stutzerimonas stutzeri TaxID=316 RepID=UPI002206E592|nr:DUF5455 family protein [Stutzerimonas stutzeri]UVO19978.1 DUF5455 family protein [Stutzerimonas stutzeri]UVO19986.1 DUF5455 family protein [Stutzerimonas stutzeri]